MAAVCEHGAECHDGTEPSLASAPEASRAWLLIEHPGPWPHEAAEAVQPAPLGSNAIVKFSTAAGSFETLISTRVRSFSGPGYSVPHSPVFLLITSVHFPSPGIVKIV